VVINFSKERERVIVNTLDSANKILQRKYVKLFLFSKIYIIRNIKMEKRNYKEKYNNLHIDMFA